MKIRMPLLIFQILILIALLLSVRAPARAEHVCRGVPAAVPDPLMIGPGDGSWGDEPQDGSDDDAEGGKARDLGTAAVALVEDIQKAPDAGVGFMDYVFPEQKIALGATGVIVLAYLDTCLVETIEGGTVTVRGAGSEVAGGSLEAANVDCKAAKPIITDQNREAGAVINRVIMFEGMDWPERLIKTAWPSWRATRWSSPPPGW